MRQENHWMLEILVSTAAGFPVGSNKAKDSGVLTRGSPDSETAGSLDPKNGSKSLSWCRKLPRILEMCGMNGRTLVEVRRNADSQ